MKLFDIRKHKLGILGGGQLGKMLIHKASQWDVKTHVLDPNVDGPASQICTRFSLGDFTDHNFVYDFGKNVDLITIEIENVDVDALMELKKQGKAIYPDPESIKNIKDKGLQKQIFIYNNIPTAPYKSYNNKQKVMDALRSGEIQPPFVQKLRTTGYDGKGVYVFTNEGNTSEILEGACIIEEYTEIEKELAVIVARNTHGEVTHYDPVEMVFKPEANLVEFLVSPANISPQIAEDAVKLAEKTMEAFNIVGLLAVELFLTKDGKILVNEIAPRPHNSGHHTIESSYTSQYEQHLRAIFGLPLGSTRMKTAAVMINLLGEPGYKGPAKYEGLEEIMKIEGVNIHIYGKSNTRPHRKMGHITIVDQSVEKAMEKAKQVKELIKVIS